MQDRPDARELLQAVKVFLEEQVVPALEGTKQFHARVAANVLAIVGRELASTEDLRAEWQRLRTLLGGTGGGDPRDDMALADAVRTLTVELATRIRRGDADGDPWRAAVLDHLRTTAAERLAIANPTYAVPRTDR